MTEFKGRFILPRRASPPGSPLTGELYLDTDDDNIYQWDGAAWVEVGAGGGGAVSSVNGETGVVVLDAADVGALPTSHESDETSVHGIADTGTLVVAVIHGAVAGTARPSAPDVVYWIGSVDPTNAAANDIWHDTTASAGTGPSFRGIVTSLPSSPVTGDMAILVDNKTTPTYRWQIVYNGDSSSSYKWEVVGGSPILAEDDDLRSLTNQTTYANLPTDPISFNLPFAGDYVIEGWADIRCGSGATGVQSAGYSYAVGATAAADTWAAQLRVNAATITSYDGNRPTGPHLWTGRAAGDTVAEKAKTGGNYLITWEKRRLRAMPVRIG